MSATPDPLEQLASTMELVQGLANTFIAAASSHREQCIAAALIGGES